MTSTTGSVAGAAGGSPSGSAVMALMAGSLLALTRRVEDGSRSNAAAALDVLAGRTLL